MQPQRGLKTYSQAASGSWRAKFRALHGSVGRSRLGLRPSLGPDQEAVRFPVLPDCADAVLEKLAASADVSARHHKYSLPDADMQDLLGDKAQPLAGC